MGTRGFLLGGGASHNNQKGTCADGFDKVDRSDGASHDNKKRSPPKMTRLPRRRFSTLTVRRLLWREGRLLVPPPDGLGQLRRLQRRHVEPARGVPQLLDLRLQPQRRRPRCVRDAPGAVEFLLLLVAGPVRLRHVGRRAAGETCNAPSLSFVRQGTTTTRPGSSRTRPRSSSPTTPQIRATRCSSTSRTRPCIRPHRSASYRSRRVARGAVARADPLPP